LGSPSVLAGSRATKLSLGESFSCARVSTAAVLFSEITYRRTIRCWGKNTRSQLGNGTYIDSATPVTSLGDPVAVDSVAAGREHACGLSGSTAPYTAKCWGSGKDDQLGNGIAGYAPKAVLLLRQPGAPNIERITPIHGGTAMRVAFNAPADTGGEAISGYTAYCAAGEDPWFTASGSVSPLTVTGLTRGVTYSCWVRAANGIGEGSTSATIVKVARPSSIAPILTTILD
jgi:hypothetical protein